MKKFLALLCVLALILCLFSGCKGDNKQDNKPTETASKELSDEELAKIVTRSAGILGIDIEKDGALEIASRSRGTPRIANRLLKRVRDIAQVRGEVEISLGTTMEALKMLQVDDVGLDNIDHSLMTEIMENFRGGPVGIDTLAATIGEESQTVEDVYEPYLMQLGFLQRTSRGRVATTKAYEHFGIPMNEND